MYQEIHEPVLTNWYHNLSKVIKAAEHDDIEAIIARVAPLSSCIPCNPLDNTNYVCPNGYACTANVADPTGDCTDYCCSKCELGDYCPKGTSNLYLPKITTHKYSSALADPSTKY